MRLVEPETGEAFSIFPLLSTAKSIHLYEGLMELMVEKSMRVFEDLPWAFSLNLSYEDIDNRRFRNYVLGKIKEFPEPERIIFEVLEMDVIEDYEVVSRFLDEMRSYGCKVAIDDFGSGYSSMENILRLKPDYIKIDGSLIHDIDHSSQSVTIVKTVVSMAKELNIKSVAEYVHSEAVYDVVKTLEVDYLQGYYTGRPFPAQELLSTEK
jgi:EAL domain-containing protein (putative c-di-GMP-specific phosphodiesterase class I)